MTGTMMKNSMLGHEVGYTTWRTAVVWRLPSGAQSKIKSVAEDRESELMMGKHTGLIPVSPRIYILPTPGPRQKSSR